MFTFTFYLFSHQIQLEGLGERCKLPQRGLGRSPSRNRIWCILALKDAIWWQQISRCFLESTDHFLFTLLAKQSNRQGGARAVLPARPFDILTWRAHPGVAPPLTSTTTVSQACHAAYEFKCCGLVIEEQVHVQRPTV